MNENIWLMGDTLDIDEEKTKLYKMECNSYYNITKIIRSKYLPTNNCILNYSPVPFPDWFLKGIDFCLIGKH